MNVTELAADASQLLSKAVTALTAPGANPAPARQLVSWGAPAADCEELVVYLSVLTPRPVGSQSCALLSVATFCTELWRCHPTYADQRGNPPSVAKLTAAADGLLTDAMALWSYFSTQRTAGTLLNHYACGSIELKPWTVLPPRGGFAGVRICLDVLLMGNLGS